MDERREPPPRPGSYPPIAADATLSPVQQAHIDYSSHVVGAEGLAACQRCSDRDRDRCPEGNRLWQAWTDACDDAYRQLHPGRR